MKKKKMETIGAKPAGWLGSIAGIIMNGLHSSAYRKIINTYIKSNCADLKGKAVLDVGCGGGISVKHFANVREIGKVVGIDYSEDMVGLSKRNNKNRIKDGLVEIFNADISALPFDGNTFDIITAFDTINFWPDHDKALAEILRTLKAEGVFFIINAYPKEGTKWYDFVKFKSDSEYKDFLIKKGLKDVEFVIENNTIIIWGRK